MQKVECDVVVIGAGPAGAMTAQVVAKKGLTVSLIERKSTVGVPVRCGEGIGIKGLSRSVHVKDEWVLNTIKTIEMVSPDGLHVPISAIDESYVVDRTLMDADLVKQAVKCGASYYNNCCIEVVERLADGTYRAQSKNYEFCSTIVVCADGVESRVARDLGWDTRLLPENIHSCCFAHVHHQSIKSEIASLYYGSHIAPGGYAWVFPRSEGTANVGLGVIGSQCRKGTPQKCFHQFITTYFPGATIDNEHVGGVPAARWVKPLVKGGALLVGDAARQVNCVSGGGIAYALHAGTIAGEAIGDAFAEGNVNYKKLKNYEKKWASDCGKHQKYSYAIKEIMVGFDDEFLESIARALLKKGGKNISLMKVFAQSFIKHPLLLLKGAALFK